MTLSHAEADFIPRTSPSLVDLFSDWLREKCPGADLKLYVTTMHDGGLHEYSVHLDRHRIGWLDDEYCHFECADTNVKYPAADPEFFEKVWAHIESCSCSL